MIKTLWASVMANPTFMRRFNGYATIAWIIMIPISLFMGWMGNVEYVSALSIWALVTGHLAAFQAARVEEKQDQQIEEANETQNDTTGLSSVAD